MVYFCCRTREKPPKYKERSEIEAMYFQINTQLKSLNQMAYVPPDGQLIQDIERAWEGLERAEHEREVALRSELRRQERLEQLNYKFDKKVIVIWQLKAIPVPQFIIMY